MPNDKKTVIVTGGAGFIGSHLCERLIEDARVICLDNFLTSDVSNIESLLNNPDFEFIKCDINAPLDLESYPELERFQLPVKGVQEIYHLACPTSAKKFDNLRIQTLLANSVGMCHVLDLAVKYRARFLHLSTSVVYGPRQRLNDGEMVPDFVVDAIDGKDLIIYGDEKFRTALLYVSDAVDGLVRLMRVSKNPGPVNFGGDTDIPLVEVARQVVALTGSASKVVFEPPLLFMTPMGIPDTRKAVDGLGWVPLVRLEDGLKKSVEYAIVTKGRTRNL